MPLLPPQRERAKKESVKSQKYGQVQNAAICKVAKCKKGIKKWQFCNAGSHFLTAHHQTFVTLHSQITPPEGVIFIFWNLRFFITFCSIQFLIDLQVSQRALEIHMLFILNRKLLFIAVQVLVFSRPDIISKIAYLMKNSKLQQQLCTPTLNYFKKRNMTNYQTRKFDSFFSRLDGSLKKW